LVAKSLTFGRDPQWIVDSANLRRSQVTVVEFTSMITAGKSSRIAGLFRAKLLIHGNLRRLD